MVWHIEQLDDAQREAYDKKLAEQIMFAGKSAVEAHTIALRHALAVRPPIELTEEAWNRDFEDVDRWPPAPPEQPSPLVFRTHG